MPSTACKETTKFNWNLFKFVCALFDTIPCSLWACNHLLSNPRLFSSYPLKIFSTVCSQQYCFSHFLPVRMYFLSLYHFTAFFFFSFFILNSSSLLPFLCCLSFSIHSWNKAGICFTVSLSSAPNQLFSLPHLYFIIFSPLSLPSIPSAWHSSSDWYYCIRLNKTCPLQL